MIRQAAIINEPQPMSELSVELCTPQYAADRQKRYDAVNITLINLGFVIYTIQRITHFSGI